MHAQTLRAGLGRLLRRPARPNTVFGGVYGAVLASSMAAALTQHGETARSDRLYDAAWLLITATVSAVAHGYARVIAERGEEQSGHGHGRTALRVMLTEWPLVLATLPTVGLFAGAGWGWWPSGGIKSVAFAVNIVQLMGWGLFTALSAGRRWGSALVIGAGDALVGVFVVVANAFVK
ncbi:hypothetical protein [Actinacidiphila oryziradicis]|jgi:hypothetical protein|uniref:Uncharacterized protein n=1 Tax=Actinacidiphila oryziradicis TaxID=2571141 RepID=A0A4U0SLH9_9ACTN|nr:hypothetical protein [Actinacidiphila oryziradicis]TKA09898.1 hypothetical protein FCI23_19675 [Actinacidiphila oryziradicis]